LPGPLHRHRYTLGGLLLLWAGLFLPAPALFAQTVTLNLKDADIRALVSTVADVTGKNFIVDPRVKGKVTVISGGPIQEKELYQLFLSVLSVHGFSTVPAGEAIKIVPAASGKSDSTPVVSAAAPGEGDELVTRVVPVENVPAAQLVPILRPLVPQTGHLAAYPGSNVLIISDSAANVTRLVHIIERIDVTGEAEVELIPLQHASAQEVVRILTTLLPPQAKGDPAEAPTRFVADERTNSILVSGDKDARLRLRAIISHLDTPMEIQGNTHVVYLRYAKAKDLVPILEGVTRGATGGKDRPGAASGAAGGEISIQADESMNALVITAPTDALASLKSVIRQLDIRRAQVLLEGIIAEVREDKARELGVQWRFTDNPEGTGAIGGTSFSVGGTSIQSVAADPTTLGAGLALGYIDGKVSILGNEILNIGALVQALASDTESNILATPTVVTLDNEEAEFIVARNLPFVTGQFTSTGAGEGVTNPFQTVERQDVGLVLRVKPQINEGNTVKLEIEQEISDVLPQAAAQLVGAVDVVTNKRSIKTSVLVEDNSMLVLSGLLEDRLTESEQKVPGLGDIPLLGYLFRAQETSKEKRNLMIFLRPHILRDVVSAGAVTSSKYSFLRAQQLDAYRRGVNLMPDSEAPLLLELQDYLEAPPGTAAIGKASPKELERGRPAPAALPEAE
jgi:general secretion pathway protein D